MNFKRYNESDNSWTDSHYIKGTDTDTITTLPATIYPLAQTATVGLKGNAVQNGTPTHDSPIMPQCTGERTGNLFSSTWESGNINSTTGQNETSITVCRTKDYIPVIPNTIYSMKRSIYTGYINVRFYRADKTYIGGGSSSTINIIVGSRTSNPMLDGVDFCVFELVDTNIAYMRINDTSNNVNTQYMMVEGQYTSSTMPKYEPYGYKIPISINNVVTDIYIGDNPLRKSLDGTAYDTLAADGTLTRRVDSDGSVLPTPIVTQVTMPTFTTTPGANTLDVLTTVPPSEVTATFNGWHPVSSAHERDNGAWT